MELLEKFLVGLYLNTTCISQHCDFNFKVTDIGRNIENAYKCQVLLDRLEKELRQQHLRIATVQNGVLSSAIKVNGAWVGKGIAFNLLGILQEKFGFNYSVVVPTENALGSKDSGIFGLLNNNEADMAAAFLPMTSIYWKYARFATTLDMGEWVAVLKRPKASNVSGITTPFNITVWMVILLSIFIMGPIIYVIISLQKKFISSEREHSISLTNCIWFVYGALLRQGTVLTPSSDSTRMIFATWWIFVTIISACYTANLTAFLTLSEFTLPIKEPRDIGNKKYHIITVSGSVIEESSLQPLEELYSTLRGASKVFVKYNEQEVLKTWITKRNYIYIAEQPNINIILYKDYLNKAAAGITELNRCTYVMTPWSVFKRPRSFAYSNKFKYSQLFDSVLRTFVEVGLVKYLSQRHLPCFTICPLNLGDKERELLNTDLLLTYYIMILGFTMAIIVFLIEMVVQVINQKNNCIHSRKVISPPPQYSVFGFNNFLNDPRWKKQNINGRDYWVMKSLEGNMKLIPIGSPSALLFQYKLQH